MNTIRRNIYLNRLITRRHNHRIKIVTGVRRSGKSFLLFNLFSEWLLANGVEKDNILKIDLEDRRNKTLRNPDALLRYIDSKMTNDSNGFFLVNGTTEICVCEKGKRVKGGADTICARYNTEIGRDNEIPDRKSTRLNSSHQD